MQRIGILLVFLAVLASCTGPAALSRPGPYCPISMIRPGLGALDFSLLDTTRNSRSLSDFQGQWVVLVIGSRTSVSYVSSIEDINRLAKKFLGRGVVFVMLYTAEANADLIEGYDINDFGRRFQEAAKPGYGIVVNSDSGPKEITGAKAVLPNMHTVVDVPPMAVAAQYGYKPPEVDNPTFIINPEGRITLVAERFNARRIENALVGLTAPGNAMKVYKAPR